jgi:hypothetical protein
MGVDYKENPNQRLTSPPESLRKVLSILVMRSAGVKGLIKWTTEHETNPQPILAIPLFTRRKTGRQMVK